MDQMLKNIICGGKFSFSMGEDVLAKCEKKTNGSWNIKLVNEISGYEENITATTEADLAKFLYNVHFLKKTPEINEDAFNEPIPHYSETTDPLTELPD